MNRPGPAHSGATVQQEAAYYQAIEEAFVSRRGDPLLLSNSDWLLIRTWRLQGIPLRIVLRGLTDAFDAHAHSWGRGRKVQSLAYCAAEVERARERWERALAMGAEPTIEAGSKLRGLADALRAASGLGRRATVVALEISAELQARASEPSTQALEEWLGRHEKRLIRALRRDAGLARMLAIEKAVDTDLEPYRGRMPDRVLSQIRGEAVSRRLLDRHGIGRLSLFY